jgi:hypothetical protein
LTSFWDVVLSRFAVDAVVTTNYDLLAERGLRHRPTKRPKRPGMQYGGLIRPQILKGTALPVAVAKAERQVQLNGGTPLYKLHGSLNWGLEAGNPCLYQDSRPAFRSGGDAQIVPPVLEKEVPSWLIDVWNEARQALSSCSTWVVCGYSLPIYDQAIAQLFTDAALAGAVTTILLLDPNAEMLLERWKVVAPDVDVHPFPGLPDGLSILATNRPRRVSGEPSRRLSSR